MAKKQIEQYEHSKEERANIPHVGLVTPTSDPETGEKKKYEYDPHLDPQLVWTGKAEHTSFEVPTVSLHVHERIDPKTIIESAKRDKDDGGQMSLFSEKKPLRKAIEFYKHREGWANRLISGDSLLVMNSLIEKEGMTGKVQMFFIDPPYGITYKSNFQPFVNKTDVKDGKDEDLNYEPETLKAFRDTWELGIHSYLTYLRDRLKLAHQLLNDTGVLVFQINVENQHYVIQVLNEIFGPENFITNIVFRKKGIPLGAKHLEIMHDHLIVYGKDKNQTKYRHLYEEADASLISSHGPYAVFPDGSFQSISIDDFKSSQHPKGTRYCRLYSLKAPSFSSESVFKYEFNGQVFDPPTGGCWIVSSDKLDKLKAANRLQIEGKSLSYRFYYDDFPYRKITSLWANVGTSYKKIYAVQTNEKILERCLSMYTDPGDLVMDITCGSGTTAYASENLGRRWITCDSSRVAIALAKQRLMTGIFDYYKLNHEQEGVSSGFVYKQCEKITMRSIANGEKGVLETLYDCPEIERSNSRITGPFTVEAVPAPHVSSFDELEKSDIGSDTSIARSGETNRQAEWRDELLRAGVRAKGGNIIQFTRVEPLTGTRFIQAEAETKEDTPKKVLVVFGPEHAPLEQRTVENAWQEARALKPDMLLFCAFQFDEEAAKDIDELTPSIAGMQLIKAQMNADLLTDDLRKKRSSNESFWLVGQPDIRVHKESDGKVKVEVMGFDYYNPKTGDVESGGKKNIAMWMMDADYDDRSLFPSQVFFPMAGSGDGWDKLAKNLKAEIDEEKIEAFNGTVSLPFEPGNKIAVKIIDDRGIESLRVITM